MGNLTTQFYNTTIIMPPLPKTSFPLSFFSQVQSPVHKQRLMEDRDTTRPVFKFIHTNECHMFYAYKSDYKRRIKKKEEDEETNQIMVQPAHIHRQNIID